MKMHYDRTRADEIASSISHGVGFFFSLAGFVALIGVAKINGDVGVITSCGIYGSTLALMYLASTLYHTFLSPRINYFFRTLDHISIFLLIAGTYTPFLFITLGGSQGWMFLSLIWSLAFAGILFRILFRKTFSKVCLMVYLGMGWLSLFIMNPLMNHLPQQGLAWLLVGGVFYTIGTIFYAWKKLVFHHAIWHLFVIAGSLCHFYCILTYVIPR